MMRIILIMRPEPTSHLHKDVLSSTGIIGEALRGISRRTDACQFIWLLNVTDIVYAIEEMMAATCLRAGIS